MAVLDTLIPENMDPSVIVPITEKLAGRLVVSGCFTVLDRTDIESVLKEREFQVSGMVSDTYFISAKMINVKTGVIANQTSAQADGKLSILIDLAQRVGDVLSGGAVLAQSAVGGGQHDISKPDQSQAPEGQPPSAASKPQKKAKAMAVLVSISYMNDTWLLSATSSDSNATKIDTAPFYSVGISVSTPYIDVGVGYGGAAKVGTYTGTDWDGSSFSGDLSSKETFATADIYGKIPIGIGSIILFPTLGFGDLWNLTVTDADTGTSRTR